MNAQATAKYIHMSPRKTRLVIDLVRGLTIDEARRQLQFSKKAAAIPVLKTLESAVANAKNNKEADAAGLRVLKAVVNEGPTFYRFKPRAYGRSAPIRKRMSHITIVVGDGKTGPETKQKKKGKPKAVKKRTKAVKKKKTTAKKKNKKPAQAKAKRKTGEKKTGKKKAPKRKASAKKSIK